MRRDSTTLQSSAKIGAFWLNVLAIALKITTSVILVICRINRDWFDNDSVVNGTIFKRDLFDNDCATYMNGSTTCAASTLLFDSQGINFWSNYNVNIDNVQPVSNSILFAGQLFNFLLLLVFVDLVTTVINCYCTKKCLPVSVISDGKRSWNLGAKFALGFIIIGLAIFILFGVIVHMTFTARYGAFFKNVDEAELGSAFHLFCLSALTYFAGEVCFTLTFLFYIKDNGGITKVVGEDQPLNHLSR